MQWTVQEMASPLTQEIVELVDREADLLNRYSIHYLSIYVCLFVCMYALHCDPLSSMSYVNLPTSPTYLPNLPTYSWQGPGREEHGVPSTAHPPLVPAVPREP